MTDANESIRSVAPTAKQVLHYIGTSLSQNSDAVSVAVTEGEDNKVKLVLTVDKADMGRVIGRHGKIAGAIRAVVRAAAAKDGVDAQVEIAEVE
ncbi:MAG: KH domain-containing protein [Actinomycetota bacterium]|nr:KH domain-containing protein [Actinomycetota bacterium]